jgi:Ca-activated chloride channel homolog
MLSSCKTVAAISLLIHWCALPTAQANQVIPDVSLSHPVLLAGTSQTTYLKVGLTGAKIAPTGPRPPVNVAFVLDKSGSMTGEKLTQAKAALTRALDRLNSNDIVSVVVYDSTVTVVLPATKLTDKSLAYQAIQSIQANGSTALFAGVSKGAAEVRKFLDRNRVNRIILLSDGRANVGLSTPGALGELGASLIREGIAVTTLGLGLDYNEDLMVELARRSDGNHMFVERASELAGVFDREFNDVLSVVAQEITITIRCAPGMRPVQLLGIDGEISGRNVVVHLNQLYSGQEKYVLLEVAVPASEHGVQRRLAQVEVGYANMATKAPDGFTSDVHVGFDASAETVRHFVNAEVLAESVLQLANKRSEQAVALRDLGKTLEARALLESNAAYLTTNADALGSDKLKRRALDNALQAENLDPKNWTRVRKGMRSQQYMDSQQQQALPPRK